MNPVKPLLLAALLGFSVYTYAAPEPSDLQDIRQAISAAQTDLKQKQAAQTRAKQTLASSQTALTQAQRELETLNRQQSIAWDKLQKLQAELEKVKTDITGTKAQVARLLESHYKNRQQNAVVLFLKNAEPGQKARYLEYARYIQQANEKVIKDLVSQQQQLAEREKAVDAELARLKALRMQKQAAVNRLNKTRNSALQQSQTLNNQIDQQTRRIASLRSDEARLNAVLANIARRNAAAKKAQAPAKRKQAEARLAQQRQNTNTKKNTGSGVRSTLTAEDRSLQGIDQSSHSGLGSLQGSLRRPIGGSISVGGGSTVGSGSVLGTSGSLPGGEQGLYFEIRYRNQAMNPLSWLR